MFLEPAVPPRKNNNNIINRGFVLGRYGEIRKDFYNRHKNLIVA